MITLIGIEAHQDNTVQHRIDLLQDGARLCSDNQYPETAKDLSRCAIKLQKSEPIDEIVMVGMLNLVQDLKDKKLVLIHACDTKSSEEFRDALRALNVYMVKL